MSVLTTMTFSAPVAFIYPTLAQKTCQLLPSAARTLEGCSRDAHMNRPITAQQNVSITRYNHFLQQQLHVLWKASRFLHHYSHSAVICLCVGHYLI
ncbi:hypothetical protein Y032_0231g2998 [Ancylostoma ceylanicum]|uniref:Uncharacterized protein n=2 Tax=Ancylostoma ceylanicum TaxID=53326 RepID=A0A016SGP8_9BILA|nr:hypothetical protein Y032_0231g2998 [Ancylostoma ceylanicum]